VLRRTAESTLHSIIRRIFSCLKRLDPVVAEQAAQLNDETPGESNKGKPKALEDPQPEETSESGEGVSVDAPQEQQNPYGQMRSDLALSS
jgi:hypothetical protein